MFSFESTGGVNLGNKKIYIHIHISEIWDGMENFFTGFHTILVIIILKEQC